ncbi:MAG: hypothetical protein H7A41_05610 [Chlamydiales bacterium]|nr:hypothetical protein [Chlamydiales bacterium]
MITTALNIPGQCIYHYVKETRTKSDLATIALALATFSGIASYYVPLSYTFASFSVYIIYAGQYHAAKKESDIIPDTLLKKIVAISLTIMIGAKIGQQIREHLSPMAPSGRWYSVSWKTPLHLVNNVLVYVVSPFYLNEVIDLKTVGATLLLPGQIICEYMDKHQTNRDKTISLIAAFSIGTLASYWVSLSYTFSSVMAMTLLFGGKTNEIPLHFSGSLYLFLLGSKIGMMIANYRFPSSSPWYSVSWRTPFHLINNTMIIGIPADVILAAMTYIDDTRPSLPDLEYTPRSMDKTKPQEEFDALKERIANLKGFKMDAQMNSEDDIRAARYILLVGKDWCRERVRENFKNFNLMTHPDKNSEIDSNPFHYITEAWKILDPIYPLVYQVSD